MKHLENDRGVAFIIELILVAFVLTLVGVAMYTSVHQKKPSPNVAVSTPAPTVSKTPTPSPDPYAGWKTFTLKYEKLSFKYPSDWKITDKSGPGDTDASGRSIQTPGQDRVEIVAPNSLKVSLWTGSTTYDFGGPNVKSIASTPVNMLGGKFYLNFISTSSDSLSGAATIETAPSHKAEITIFPGSKNITLGQGATNNPAVTGLPAPFNLMSLTYDKPDSPQYSVAHFQQDQNYGAALKILESLHY